MAVSRMKKVAQRLHADKTAMRKNLENAGGKVKGSVLAESAYILLGEAGVSDGHEIIRKITLECEQTDCTFFEALKNHRDIYEKITAQLTTLGVQNAETFFENPAHYCGLAAEKSQRLAAKWRNAM